MRLFYLLIFSFYFHIVVGQNNDSLLNKKISEVVVTGQLLEKNAEDAVHKIRIIGSRELNSGLFNNLAALLSKELNIRLSEDNILGSSVSIQGVSGQNVKILIDDIPVIGRLNGNIDLSQIMLDNVERIEIVEGPLSTIYGTDALAGTINIITKKIIEDKKYFNSYYESIGKYNYDFLISKNIEKNTAIYQFGRNYFNGWSSGQDFQLFPINELADIRRNKRWKPKEQIFHRFSYNIAKDKYSNNNHFETFYEKITNRGLPLAPYNETAFDEYYHTYRTNLGSDINLNYDESNIKLILAYNNYVRAKETFYKDLTNLSQTMVQDASTQDTSNFNLWMVKAIINKEKNKNLRYQLGFDFSMENAKGGRILDGYQEKSDYAFFSTLEYNLTDYIQVRPSIRLIYNDKYKAPLVPAINALFDFKNYKLRISYAKGFRAPDFKELFLEFVDINHNIVGNELLLAEESNNFNINTTISQFFLENKIVTDVSFFYNQMFNKIDLANLSEDSDQYSYFNIENYATKGISLRSTILLANTSINLGMSYIGRFNKLSDEYDVSKFNFSKDFSLGLIFNLGSKNKLNIFYKRTGELPNFVLDNNSISEVYSDAYDIMDFSLNRRLYNDFIILTFGVKNLFNITDIKNNIDNITIHSNTNNIIPIGYGRTFFTQIKFSL